MAFVVVEDMGVDVDRMDPGDTPEETPGNKPEEKPGEIPGDWKILVRRSPAGEAKVCASECRRRKSFIGGGDANEEEGTEAEVGTEVELALECASLLIGFGAARASIE